MMPCICVPTAPSHEFQHVSCNALRRSADILVCSCTQEMTVYQRRARAACEAKAAKRARRAHGPTGGIVRARVEACSYRDRVQAIACSMADDVLRIVVGVGRAVRRKVQRHRKSTTHRREKQSHGEVACDRCPWAAAAAAASEKRPSCICPRRHPAALGYAAPVRRRSRDGPSLLLLNPSAIVRPLVVGMAAG